MFKSRWSTFTVLCVSALVALLAFRVGWSWSQDPTIHNRVGAQISGAPAQSSSAATTGNAMLQAVASSPQSAEELVRKLLAQPPTPARNEALLAAIEKLAALNPLEAIAIARAESNRELSQQMLDAAFTGWGRVDASRATDWVLAQPEGSLDANAAISAILKGAVQQNPETAIQLTQHLEEVNPSQAREYGDALIYALGQNGGFQMAADFAAAGSGDQRTEWLAAAYGNWANYQPEAAANYAMAYLDPDTRGAAIDAIIPNWAQINPKTLADFAMNNLPDGDQKTRALTDALVYWASTDTTAAADWLDKAGSSPAFDAGVAAVATQQDVMKVPDEALNWAQTITDVNLRSRTIMAIVQTWALSDPSKALSYVQNTPDLQSDDRNSLLASLNSSSQ